MIIKRSEHMRHTVVPKNIDSQRTKQSIPYYNAIVMQANSLLISIDHA